MAMLQNLGTFESDADQSLRQLRHAFVALMDQAGLSGIKPMALARELRIDKSLAWKIHRVVYPEAPMDVVRHLPGPAGVDRFIRAIKNRYKNSPELSLVQTAIRELERIIELHCGDRATFQMMMNSVTEEPSEEIAERHRQDLVRGACYVWGAHARVTVRAEFIAPSKQEGMLDIASVRGFVDFVRYRPNVPWVLSHMRLADDELKPRPPIARHALDPARQNGDATPLLTAYCSQPLPEIRRVGGPVGYLIDELVEQKVGATGLVTCITGERADGFAPYHRDESNKVGRHRFLVRTPTDLLIFDLYAHRDLQSAMNPEFILYGNLESDPGLTARALERYRLPATEQVKSLGAYPPRPATPEVPRYDEMIAHTFELLDWQMADFAGFRVQMKYPPLPATAVLQWPLAERTP